MDTPSSTIPWSTPELWAEANAGLAAVVARQRPALRLCLNLAQSIRQRLESTFPIMDDLCNRTCPDCTDICCLRAWVWADFRDLLFLHLAGIAAPDRQLRDRTGGPCRFAGPAGCGLERIRRPFVCTWYRCPAQTRLLDRKPVAKQELSDALDRIKNDRKRMEAGFIQAIR
jgi:hypothetical protein